MRLFTHSLTVGLLASLSCGSPTAPQNPTWADVQPILAGACTHCHGATTAVTGASLRFDFYDMSPATCGDAAQALDTQILAHASAAFINTDVTSPGSGWRPRMPPAPAPTLEDWERETLQRWAMEPDPLRGEPHRDNRRPEIQLYGNTGIADARLTFSSVITDFDGDSVVGVITIEALSLLKMDHPGAFAANIDTSSWPPGVYPISAVLCDGWGTATYALGNVQVKH